MLRLIRLSKIEWISLLLFWLKGLLLFLVIYMEWPRLFVTLFVWCYWLLPVNMLFYTEFPCWLVYNPYCIWNGFYWRLYRWKPSYWNPFCPKEPWYFWLLLCAMYLLYYYYTSLGFVIFGEYFCSLLSLWFYWTFVLSRILLSFWWSFSVDLRFSIFLDIYTASYLLFFSYTASSGYPINLLFVKIYSFTDLSFYFSTSRALNLFLRLSLTFVPAAAPSISTV